MVRLRSSTRFLLHGGAEDPATAAAVAAMLAVPGVRRVLATDRAAFLAAFPFFAAAGAHRRAHTDTGPKLAQLLPGV